MWLLAIIISIMLSLFSTAVMSYIAMATPIGPWIASTLVLIAMLLFRLFKTQGSSGQGIALVTASGSVGGIMATAMGFSLPTLYFLDPVLFNGWMAYPWYFASIVSALAFVAGWFGMWIANLIEYTCIVEDKLPYPIGQLIYKMIAVEHDVRKSWQLVIGFVSTTLFCMVQDGLLFVTGIIPKTVALVGPATLSIVNIPIVPIDLWPLLWAIGFVTGHVIAMPLVIGALSKIFIIEPLNYHFFPAVKNIEFVLAFCSGMVLAGAIQGLLSMPAALCKGIKKISSTSRGDRASKMRSWHIFIL